MGLAADLALALDPVLLAEAAGLTPDPWQAAVLRSSAPRVLLNVTRQGGKSTITAVLAVHDALYTPDRLVLLLSPSLRQSSELFKKVLLVYQAAGRPVAAVTETALHLALANGSRIVALPGKEETIRGFSGVTRLIVDEAARVPDALYYAVRPMLAVSGGPADCDEHAVGQAGVVAHRVDGGWRGLAAGGSASRTLPTDRG